MKNTKILKYLTLPTVVISPIVAVVSCGDKKEITRDFSKYRSDFSDINWNNYNYRDGEIISWERDGDTPDIKLSEKDGSPYLSGGTLAEFGLRIAGIDTPEAHAKDEKTGKWGETKGEEFRLTKLSWDYAKKIMPAGTKIRVCIGAEKSSYNRLVGSLFYGKDFSHNWSVELLSRGFANPFLTDIGGYKDDPSNILNELALPIADAFNYANNKKLGIFTEKAQKGLTTHGSTNTTSVIWDTTMVRTLAIDNIYYLEGILKLPKRVGRRR